MGGGCLKICNATRVAVKLIIFIFYAGKYWLLQPVHAILQGLYSLE